MTAIDLIHLSILRIRPVKQNSTAFSYGVTSRALLDQLETRFVSVRGSLIDFQCHMSCHMSYSSAGENTSFSLISRQSSCSIFDSRRLRKQLLCYRDCQFTGWLS